jgi:hypothetical protein
MREFELELQARLIIYKLFDRFVMNNLDMLYGEVNHQLIQAGVLPQIRDKHTQGTSRVPGAGPSAPAMPQQHGLPIESVDSGYATGYGGGEYDPASAQLAEIYSTVRSLLAMRRGMRPDYNPQAASVPSFAPIDLLSALTILQNQAMLPHAQPATAADAAFVAARSTSSSNSEQVQADQKVQVAAADEDTIWSACCSSSSCRTASRSCRRC